MNSMHDDIARNIQRERIARTARYAAPTRRTHPRAANALRRMADRLS